LEINIKEAKKRKKNLDKAITQFKRNIDALQSEEKKFNL